MDQKLIKEIIKAIEDGVSFAKAFAGLTTDEIAEENALKRSKEFYQLAESLKQTLCRETF